MGDIPLAVLCVYVEVLSLCRVHARREDNHEYDESSDADAKTDVAIACEPVGDVAEEGAGGDDGDVGELRRDVVEMMALCSCRGENGGVGDG